MRCTLKSLIKRSEQMNNLQQTQAERKRLLVNTIRRDDVKTKPENNTGKSYKSYAKVEKH